MTGIKGVILKGNRYHYERAWPKAVRTLVPADAIPNKFRYSLGLSRGAKEAEIHQAAVYAAEFFERECNRLTNSTQAAITEGAAQRAVSDAMAKAGVSDGRLTAPNFPPSFMAVLKGEFGLDDVAASKVVEAFFNAVAESPELAEALPPENTQLDRVINTEAKRRMRTRGDDRPRLLSQLWPLYCRFNDVEMNTEHKKYRAKLRDWERTMQFVGDHPVNEETDKEINRGLKAFVTWQLDNKPDLKVSSALRAIAMPKGCFQWASDQWELGWSLRPVNVASKKRKKSEVKRRATASAGDMINFVHACLDWGDHVAVQGILACHGIIPSEIARMERLETLESDLPYLYVPPAKTEERERVVPIMYGHDLLVRHLAEQRAYSAKKINEGKGDPTAALNKRIRHAFKDSGLVLYSFRHGIRNQFIRGEVSTPIMSAILGWAAGDHGTHLHYGQSGIEDSDFMRTLHKASQRAHKPVIEALAKEKSD